MNAFLKVSYPNIIILFCFSLIVGLIFSPALLSISMIALVILGLLRIEICKGRPYFRLNVEGLKRVQNISRYPAFLAITLFFLVCAIRFYPLGDAHYFLERLRIKAPFVFFPLAFLALPRFDDRRVKLILYFLLFFLAAVSVGILINYALNFERYTTLIKEGHHIPTPRNHIRYSLLAAWAVVCGIYLYIEGYVNRYAWEKWLVVGSTLFLIIFLHILSVKSGLLLLYCSLFFALLQYIWKSKAFLTGTLGLLLVLALPIIAYQTLPSFKNKVAYFQYDMLMYQQGEGANYSDSGRLASLDAGWRIAKDHWVWGVGTANIRNEVRLIFEADYANYPEEFMPQNQFLFSWASTGILGMLVVVFAFFYPIFHQKKYQHWLTLNFFFSIFIIIMIEHALENAVGVAHYLFFCCLFLSFLTPIVPWQEKTNHVNEH